MVYEVYWSEKSRAQLEKLNRKEADMITAKVHSIRDNPFKHVKKLIGLEFYSLRVGDYRVIMSIEKGKLVVFVLEVGHRKNIYRKY